MQGKAMRVVAMGTPNSHQRPVQHHRRRPVHPEIRYSRVNPHRDLAGRPHNASSRVILLHILTFVELIILIPLPLRGLWVIKGIATRRRHRHRNTIWSSGTAGKRVAAFFIILSSSRTSHRLGASRFRRFRRHVDLQSDPATSPVSSRRSLRAH